MQGSRVLSVRWVCSCRGPGCYISVRQGIHRLRSHSTPNSLLTTLLHVSSSLCRLISDGPTHVLRIADANKKVKTYLGGV